MSLHIEFDGIRQLETRTRIENAVGECVGEPPESQERVVSVTSFRDFCTVVVKTQQQKRRKTFFLAALDLPDAVQEWLNQYPLR